MALSHLNELTGGSLVGLSRSRKPYSIPKKIKSSFFETCERDDSGRCKPKGGGSDTKPKDTKPNVEDSRVAGRAADVEKRNKRKMPTKADIDKQMLLPLRNEEGNVELLWTRVDGKEYVIKPSQNGREGAEREKKISDLAYSLGLPTPKVSLVDKPNIDPVHKVSRQKFDDDAWMVQDKFPGVPLYKDKEWTMKPEVKKVVCNDFLFNWMVGNYDRNGGNIMVNGDRAYSIDFDSTPSTMEETPPEDCFSGSMITDINEDFRVDKDFIEGLLSSNELKEVFPSDEYKKRRRYLERIMKINNPTVGDVKKIFNTPEKEGFFSRLFRSPFRKSYFSECDRDKYGHCKPKDSGKVTSEPNESDKKKKDRKEERIKKGEKKKWWREFKQNYSLSGIAKKFPKMTSNYEKSSKMTWGQLGKGALTAVGGIGKMLGRGVKWVGKKSWNALPSSVKKGVLTAVAVGQSIEHSLEGVVTGSQKLVEKVARARGLDRVQAKKVKRICKIVDTVARWSTNIPIAHAGIEHVMHDLHIPDEHVAELPDSVPLVGGLKIGTSFGLAKLGYYVPVASLAYLGYSAARNPIKTAKAARDFFFSKDEHSDDHHKKHETLFNKIGRIMKASKESMKFKSMAYLSKDLNDDQHKEMEERIDQLSLAIERYASSGDKEKDSWFISLLMAALDVTHDFDTSLELAITVFREVNTTPKVSDDNMLDWLPMDTK